MKEAMELALEALEEIALAGMSVAPEMIDSKEAFHARQAWRFIGIAARALEPIKQALAEQPAQPAVASEQEPVAWQAEVLIQGVWSPVGNPQRDKSRAERLAAIPSIPKECQRVIDFYTAPYVATPRPQRTEAQGEDTRRAWVGLTDDEINTAASVQSWKPFARAIEDKLKAKNT